MNWFTKEQVASATPEKKKDLITNWGGCEHVEADPSSLVVVQYENDSFGREGYCICAACLQKQKEEEDLEEVFCPDCKTSVLKKNTMTWTWYDFYPAQGDEALVICKGCWSKEKHQERMRRDNADRADELGD